MKKIFCIISLTLIPLGNIFLQNLISNSDFNDVNICHEYQIACSPKAWRTTGYKAVKYHNSQLKGATTDNSYIELLLLDESRDFDRKFIQTALLCELIKDEKYTLSLRIKPHVFHINSIGVFFSDTLIFTETNMELENLKPDLIVDIPENIRSKEWATIEQTFTAKGNEQVIVIGNFASDSLTFTHPINKKKAKKIQKKYHLHTKVIYGIDDVSLTPINSTPDCDLESNKIKIYRDSFRHSFQQLITETAVNKDTLTTFTPNPQKEKTTIPPIHETIVLNNIEFEFGKAILRSERLPELEKIIRLMEENNKIIIEINGYTDNIGSELNNLKLSEDRAKAVFNYLAEKGIHKKRMSYKGWGETNPLADNETDEGRKTNRRVEVVIFN
jgi:outer membrane protein OmpA-like peptidoglycan-associated protein